ncbi:unnamed protein product [Trypanosoma congolense IL3000]|uniref:WGS project CAEQ00000000 data, annotated contig 153 n=1 Tax=Trypanosoma congolense (strain IL3000) TaxID=1068625 RepID=F9W6W3_TRYCI|nr:unnamed protein product [Trypanosoma congolense IL3000]
MQTLLKSTPGEPSLFSPPPSRRTQLWGVWEMWCVLPDSHESTCNAVIARGSSSKKAAAPTLKKATWLDRAKSIGLFDSAEGFWGIVTCTLPPSQLPQGFNYYLFRRNIAPMWEHEANRRGGRWIVSFRSHSQENGSAITPGCKDAAGALQPQVDHAWETLCIAMIGEQIPCDETEICGAVVRRTERCNEWKLSLWTRTASDRATQQRIGNFVRDLLHLDGDALQYLSHRELMQATGKSIWDAPQSHGL